MTDKTDDTPSAQPNFGPYAPPPYGPYGPYGAAPYGPAGWAPPPNVPPAYGAYGAPGWGPPPGYAPPQASADTSERDAKETSAGWGYPPGFPPGWGNGWGHGFGHHHGGWGPGCPMPGWGPGWAPPGGPGFGAPPTAAKEDGSLFSTGLGVHNDALIKGLLIGAGLTFLFTNETVQKNLIGAAVKVWSTLQGGVEEMKERFRDAEAELAAGEEPEQ